MGKRVGVEREPEAQPETGGSPEPEAKPQSVGPLRVLPESVPWFSFTLVYFRYFPPEGPSPLVAGPFLCYTTLMKAKSHLSPEYIASILHYDPDTGIFTWKVRRGNKLAGSRAGSLDKEYCRIRIKRKHYRASRLAVVIMTGKWPERLMDHKDRHRGNDKWTNLRQATSSQNALNRGPQLSLFPHLGI